MKIKKILAICCVLAIAVCSFAGCNNAKTNSSSDTSNDTSSVSMMNEGQFTVGVEIGYPPFEKYADDGTTPIGYDIDVATAIADKMGLEVNFIDTAWDGIFAGIDTNYDVVISAVTITDERKETMLFSDPYIQNYQSIVVPKGSDLKFESLNDLDGMSIALQKETTSDEILSDLIDTKTISAKYVAQEKVTTCFKQLSNGEVDVVLCDSTVADGYIASDPDKYEIAYTDETNAEEFGVAMGKDNTQLQKAVNEAMTSLEEEGFFTETYDKWFKTTD